MTAGPKPVQQEINNRHSLPQYGSNVREQQNKSAYPPRSNQPSSSPLRPSVPHAPQSRHAAQGMPPKQSFGNPTRPPPPPPPQPRAPQPQNVPEEPAPRGMQETGRYNGLSVPNRAGIPSAKDTLREKAARNRRRMQVDSGRATPVTSNRTMMQSQPNRTMMQSQPNPSIPIPMNSATSAPVVPKRESPPKNGMRMTMRERHRRRLEARKRSPAPTAAN